MATELDIVDVGDAIAIRATHKPSWVNGVLSAVATGVFASILAFHFVTWPVLISGVAVASCLAFVYATRERTTELRVTRVEFAARGRVGDNLGSSRAICSADIQWLEYQEDTTGPETAHHPGGLYAVLGCRSVCLLPDVSEQQTALVIERINDRFPDLQKQWQRKTPFGKHFISLGLDEPQ